MNKFRAKKPDPRILILQIVLSVLLVSSIHTYYALIALFGVLDVIIFVFCGWKAFLKKAIGFAVMLGAMFLLMKFNVPVLSDIFPPFLMLLVRVYPTWLTLNILKERVRMNEMLYVLDRMHVPKTFSIPLMVVYRYVPTILQELHCINESLAMRERNNIRHVNKLAETLDGERIMTSALELSAVKNATSAQKQKGVLTVTEGKSLYNILDLDNEVTKIKSGTIALSRKFASELNLKTGDTVYWHLYTRNEWHQAKVGVIYRSSETQGMTMLYEDYMKSGEEYTPTMLMSDKTEKNIKSNACVASVNTKKQMKEAFEKSMEIVNILVYMMMIFSAICVIVVLYNSGSLSFNERIKELATLKVLGFQSGAIRKMMSKQNMWLSIIGIILGAPFGRASFNIMMNSNGENFDYNLSIRSVAYVEAGIFVLVVSVLVSFMFSKRIRKLDMVEVLKGVE